MIITFETKRNGYDGSVDDEMMIITIWLIGHSKHSGIEHTAYNSPMPAENQS